MLGSRAVSYTHLDVYKRQILDIGPYAGVHGGEIVAEGQLEDILKAPRSLTGQFLSGKRRIEVPKACLLYTSRCV